jgi:hypothetical protein
LQFLTRKQTLKALSIDLPTTFRPLAIITLQNRVLNPVASSPTMRAKQQSRWQKEGRRGKACYRGEPVTVRLPMA